MPTEDDLKNEPKSVARTLNKIAVCAANKATKIKIKFYINKRMKHCYSTDVLQIITTDKRNNIKSGTSSIEASEKKRGMKAEEVKYKQA
jgi:hypothetical protein